MDNTPQNIRHNKRLQAKGVPPDDADNLIAAFRQREALDGQSKRQAALLKRYRRQLDEVLAERTQK